MTCKLTMTTMLRAERVAVLALAFAVTAATPPPSTPPVRRGLPGHFHVGHFHPISRRPMLDANVISNPGFESGGINRGWIQCGDVPAFVTHVHPYAGAYDEYSGARNGRAEPRGNSGVCQQVTVPRRGVLRARLYQVSDETDVTYAYQEADLLDSRGNVVVNLYKAVNDRPAWVLGTWNLATYAGGTYWLYFGVHGDGLRGRSTQQFLDEVSLTPARE